MSVNLGWKTVLKISGTSTAFLAAATTTLAADSAGRARRQITNTAQRILDPATAVVVKSAGVAVSAANVYSIDPLFGIVTFEVAYSPGTITVDGSYLPLVEITEGRSYSANFERTAIDTTTFDSAVLSSGGRRTSLGLRNVSGDFELIEGLDPDLDVGAGSVVLNTLLDNATAKLIEITYQAGYYLRAWVIFPNIERSASPDELLTKRHSWQTTAQDLTGNYKFNAFAGVGQ